MALRAVFIDKDGTLIEDVPYDVDPGRIRLLPGVEEGVRALYRAGYYIVVISNQSGVARGYFSEAALHTGLHRIQGLLAEAGVPLVAFYYCPHHPEGLIPQYRLVCTCRKPGPGMLHQAAQDHGIDLSASWCIGDLLDDVEAGRRAGCRTVLIRHGGETEWRVTPQRTPHYLASSVDQAAALILAEVETLPGSRFDPLTISGGTRSEQPHRP